MPVQRYQGQDVPFFMSSALNSLGICFPDVISVSSHKGTQGGPSSNYFFPWMTKKCFALTAFLAQSTPWDQGSLSHYQPQGPRLPRLRHCRGRFPSHRSGPCRHTPCFRVKQGKYPQHLILKPSAREHSWPDSSHPWKQTCRGVLNPSHVSGCPLCHAFCMLRCVPLNPLQMSLWRQS